MTASRVTLVSPEPEPIRSVYVHAPFCARRCPYCDFAVHVRERGDLDLWIEALTRELDLLEQEGAFLLAAELDTLFVGGGTPSLLGPDAMGRLAEVLGPSRLGRATLEWTAEANPESFTEEVASAWRSAGVNRLSLGVQSFHQGTLRWMGRLHGPEGARAAVARARAAGFAGLNVDLIFGLPPALGRSWSADLEEAIALDVPHLSLYGHTVEPGTPLARWVGEGRVTPVEDERFQEEYLEAVERLGNAGYRHYEVSNFARAGYESRHNRVYWEGGSYLGLGNGSHSFQEPVRRWNLRDWIEYQEATSRSVLPLAGSETLGPDARRLEHLWLSLRTRVGVRLEELGPRGRALAKEWVDRGLAEEADGHLRLNASGWLVMDRLTVELDEADTDG